ncbi:MAG: ompR [Pedosphaera sp.]|nr:ompR [Pedosphaera sp.]
MGEIPHGHPRPRPEGFFVYAHPFMKDDRPISTSEAANAQASRESNPPHCILLVDDDSDIREISTNLLTKSGFHVDTAEDGAIAWDAIQAKSYDLLITDNNMPKVTGIELVRKLRAARMNLPIIMASGTIPVEDLSVHPGLQLAATLLKPFSGNELLETVQKVLRVTDAASGRGEPPTSWQSQPTNDGLLL